MLELKDATLTIGGRQLFGNLSFMAQDGHITCITGPAGSGKTLLLQALLGLLALDEGPGERLAWRRCGRPTTVAATS